MDEPQISEQPVVPQEQVQPSVPEVSAMPATGGISGKVIAIVVGLLVLAGGVGAYFMFFNKASTTTTSNTNPGQNTGAVSFQCGDILSDSKFQEITGKNIADYKLIQEGEDPAVAGLNMLPGQPGAGDLASANGLHQVVCSYVALNDPYLSMGWVSGQIIYSVTWGGVDASTAFTIGKNVAMSMAGKTEIQLNGKTLKLPQPIPAPVDAPGIGASAYWNNNTLSVLSSNKKYSLTVIKNKIPNSETMSEELAKVVDANLNKY